MSSSSVSSSSSVGSDVLRRRAAAAAAATGPHVDPAGSTVLVHGSFDGEASDFLDNYELDAEGGDEYTLSQKMAHYCGGAITQEHWAACKAVLCFHAGCATSKLSQMTKVVKEAAMLELYLASVARLDPLVFCEGARTFFCRSFRKKDEPVTAEHLYRYYLDSRRTMRNVILPVFPKDLVSLKSGKGFHESCNEVYAIAYRQEMAKLNTKGVPKFTADALKTMQPPPLWEFSKLPWYLGLAVKIFRRDPQLAPNVGDVICDPANIPLSRAAMKRKKQMEDHHPVSATSSNINKRRSTSASHSNIGKERRYVPACCDHAAFLLLTSFSIFDPAGFFQRQEKKKMLATITDRRWLRLHRRQQSLLMRRNNCCGRRS
jgi:hypothetical protein